MINPDANPIKCQAKLDDLMSALYRWRRELPSILAPIIALITTLFGVIVQSSHCTHTSFLERALVNPSA